MSAFGVHWREVEPMPVLAEDLSQVLATVDTLHIAWREFIQRALPAAVREGRERSLRRHAIETGIIERLYDVDWGVTEALVAEGLTLEVAAREGGVSDDALETIRAQFDALQFLADYAREGRPFTVHFVRELHQALTMMQETYDARNSLGQSIKAPLHHGTWKLQANHVRRSDGTLYEYTPPERVQDQMEALVAEYAGTSGHHPVARSAWLHHRFIVIHPFEDGNGRVARALSLLVLLQADYAPLVVDRGGREAYIDALDSANTGDLSDLIRLFARLEIVALRSELESPVGLVDRNAGAIDVARAYVERIQTQIKAGDEQRRELAATLADELIDRVEGYLTTIGHELQETFCAIDESARFVVKTARPPEPESKYWRSQIIRSAREVDFFSNFTDGTWWSRLHLHVLGLILRYVVVLQKVGHGETGVLALTMFAETLASVDGEDVRPQPTPIVRLSSKDSITLVHNDDGNKRWTEVAAAIDRSLAASVAHYAQSLG